MPDLQCYVQPGGNMLECLLSDLIASLGGEAFFAVLVSAIILVTMYVAGDGSFEAPAVAMILIGAAAIPMLPAQFASIGMTIIVLGVASALLGAARRRGIV